GGDVPVQVVDRSEREPASPGQRLRGRETDEERADEPRPGGDGDHVDIVEASAALGERRVDHGRYELEMAARCDLRHDAAVARVQLGLGGDDARPDLAVDGD